MFTENEIANFINDDRVSEKTQELKNKFKKKEAEFLNITDHDFLALVMLTPKVGIAKADGGISLFEEISLNKKARKLSKGGYFLKKDPVVSAMQFLIKDYYYWEDNFLELIRYTIDRILEKNPSSTELLKQLGGNSTSFLDDIWSCPYYFIRLISSLVLDEDEDIILKRNIKKVEYDKVLELSEKMGLREFPVFEKFCNTYHIK